MGDHVQPNDETTDLSGSLARRVAILISNDRFENNKIMSLRWPAHDNHTLGKLLADPELGQFEVSSLINEGLLTVRKKIALTCTELTRNDTFLLYYSGPCFANVDGSLCLLVADSDPDIISATSIESSFILSQLLNTKCRRIALIIDGAHSGAFFRNNRGIPDGMIALTSCSSTQMSYVTEEGGFFTQTLIKGICDAKADYDNDGRVSVDELYDYAIHHHRVSDVKSSPQKWVWNLSEPIYLVNKSKHVFISYAREDQELADSLFQELQHRGMSLWMDREEITGGQDWLTRIAVALDASKAIILVLSQSSMNSTWVRRELEFADQRGIPVIPVEFSSCNLPPWFDLQFGRIQRYFVGKQLGRESVDAIADMVKGARRRVTISEHTSTT